MKCGDLRALTALAVIAAAAAGCTKTNDEQPVANPPAAAAKVNSKEISSAQVNTVLARLGNLPAEQSRQAGRQVLDKLIDAELLAQQAIDRKLDKDPKVLQALEVARREILANAYLEQASASLPLPADTEIRTYYDANPALFRDRRMYSLREVSVAAGANFVPALQEEVSRAKSLDEIIAWLKAKGVGFTPNTVTKPAEQLPRDVVPRLLAMKDGEIILIPTPNGLLLEQRVAAEPKPVDEAAAKPFIERILLAQRRQEAAAKELKAQRDKAKIEYLGDNADASASVQTTSTQPPQAK